MFYLAVFGEKNVKKAPEMNQPTNSTSQYGDLWESAKRRNTFSFWIIKDELTRDVIKSDRFLIESPNWLKPSRHCNQWALIISDISFVCFNRSYFFPLYYSTPYCYRIEYIDRKTIGKGFEKTWNCMAIEMALFPITRHGTYISSILHSGI